MAEALTLGEPSAKGEDQVLIAEDSILEAKVLEAKIYTTRMTDDNGDPVKKVKFKFGLVPEGATGTNGEEIDIKGRKVYGETSTSFVAHEGCRLYSYTLAILGINELPKGFALQIDDDNNITGLVGGQCRVILEVNTWDDKKNPVTDPDTGVVTIPKRANNRVKGVAKSRSAAVPADSPYDEEPFRVDAGEWWPEVGLGKYPTRLLP